MTSMWIDHISEVKTLLHLLFNLLKCFGSNFMGKL